ncbi:MAG: TetR/AcrR family transcriptional regulator [Burkholderiaceae bacterium]|nr:TetR/AcrR family transcriptional regulator [Burkholderiaceae bacterium]
MSNPQPYHHGNLREALIDAACAAVAEHGHETLSLRSLAEVVGVARSAPYRHFPEKDALLAEVALRGFRQLEVLLGSVIQSHNVPGEQLLAAGRSFLSFVRDNPHLFRLMYEAQLLSPESHFNALADSMAAGYRFLEQIYQRYAPEPSVRKSQLRMIGLWSTLYGYAKIRQGGMLQPYMTSALSEDEIELAILECMIDHRPN